ncbi:hypothetical protein K435DRAFT_839555 [Dendrothele bispora CBS 962.96]|uniref:Uncharacterized protein n=1 Tax=Dendrothele bispora (strain CBS 962.96) TaxID=1314807 RepID=A0A4S8M0K1_DENBC|nr:hypothetical protein K435DRAFT_839555 [Dendrothele bispora CBS 962.96]
MFNGFINVVNSYHFYPLVSVLIHCAILLHSSLECWFLLKNPFEIELFPQSSSILHAMDSSTTPLAILSVGALRTQRASSREGLDFASHACHTDRHSPDLCYPVDPSPRADTPSNEFEQVGQRERHLLEDFNHLKHEYDVLRLKVDGEMHNLTTANHALNQVVLAVKQELEAISNLAVRSFRGNITRLETETLNYARVLGSAMSAAHYSVLHDDLSVIQERLKAVGMAYDSLTTFLNQAFNSSRAVTGFSNETDDIVVRILKYASEDVPGIETFLKSTPAPIPIAIKPFTIPPTTPLNSAVLAGARVGYANSITQPTEAGPSQVNHPLPARPVSFPSNIGGRRRRRRRGNSKRNPNNFDLYKGKMRD